MHSSVSPNLEEKNKASMFNYLCIRIYCYHRTGLSTSFSLFRKPKNQCMKKKTYLNFQIPLFPGKQFCKLRIFDLRNPSVRALLRLVTRGQLFSTTTVKGSVYCTICRVWHKNGRGGGWQSQYTAIYHKSSQTCKGFHSSAVMSLFLHLHCFHCFNHTSLQLWSLKYVRAKFF